MCSVSRQNENSVLGLTKMGGSNAIVLSVTQSYSISMSQGLALSTTSLGIPVLYCLAECDGRSDPLIRSVVGPDL